MTVGELITKLMEFDPNATVMHYGNEYYDSEEEVNGVEEYFDRDCVNSVIIY